MILSSQVNSVSVFSAVSVVSYIVVSGISDVRQVPSI